VYFGIELSWIFLFGWMAWTALVAFLALEMSVATLVAARLKRLHLAPLLIAGAWTGVELFKERWPYGGYSWGAVGTTQGTVPGVRWLAGVVGTYGLSFLVVLVAAATAFVLTNRRVPWTSLGIGAAALLAFVVADLIAGGVSARDGAPVRIGVVQGDVPRPVIVGQSQEILASHERLTRELLARDENVDVVVWPEQTIGEEVGEEGLASVRQLARSEDVPFLVGQTVVDERGFFNLVRHVDADGRIAATYQKRHPVPFGERVPIGFLRRYVSTLSSQLPTDQVPGEVVRIFDVGGTQVATPICFESVFPRDVVAFARQGAEVIVLSTNDSSFERSYSAQQHLAHTRMRALETRQWIVQAALSGISARIAPDGRITQATGLFEPATFVANVRARKATSLYVKTGDLFAAMFAVAALVALAITAIRRPKVPVVSAE
jgi:apolipoprotein N-acyltransferase